MPLMNDRQRWVLASGNAAKLAELGAILGSDRLELVPMSQFKVPSPAETGTSFVENALRKARHAAAATGLPAIADDSGLSVATLGGRPGVRSARFAGPDASDKQNIDKLLRELGAAEAEHRAASFHCVIVALKNEDDPAPLLSHGSWQGVIATRPRGTWGFGYDSVFIVPEFGRTVAELDPGLKNQISHRAQALAGLRDDLLWPVQT
jgi:XTP/dITP diphosphohydrolase